MIDTAIAIHESAHLLAGYLNAAKITKVVVDSFLDSTTNMRHPGLWKTEISPGHPLTKQAILILLAGPCAEFKFTGKKDMQIASHDLRMARACLKVKGFESVMDDAAFFETHSTDAQRFVDHPLRWKMIENFAVELQNKRCILGREAVVWIQETAENLSAVEQLELMFPTDKLGGDQLPLEQHGGGIN